MAGLSPISCTSSAACSTICRCARRATAAISACFPAPRRRARPVRPSAASSSAVKLPVELVDHLERAEQFAAGRAKRHAQQRARLIAELAIDVAIDRVAGRRDASTRRGWPVCTTWPTTPESSGMRSSPPGTPSAGRPTSVWFGRSQRKMLARSASSSRWPPRPFAPAAAPSRWSGSTGWRSPESLPGDRCGCALCVARGRPRAGQASPPAPRFWGGSRAVAVATIAGRAARRTTACTPSGAATQPPATCAVSRSSAPVSRSIGNAAPRANRGNDLPLWPRPAWRRSRTRREPRERPAAGPLEENRRAT